MNAEFFKQNSKYFRPGATFTERTLCKMCNITIPTINKSDSRHKTHTKLNNFQLAKAAAYTKLNKHLVKIGLAITQKGGNKYLVVGGDDAVALASRYSNYGRAKQDFAARLQAGISRFDGYTPQARFRAMLED